MNEYVKIVYCHDENKNHVFYKDTEKGSKYYCIDCGEELVVRDGDIKIKHLSHKNATECCGTGESIFHKFWKEHFKKGMLITVKNTDYEIQDVLLEVCLNDKYKINWKSKIIADVLLITNGGDVVIEIDYSNPKKWLDTCGFYEQTNFLEVFEVTVGKTVNGNNIWKTRDEILKNINEKNIRKKEKRLVSDEEKSKRIKRKNNKSKIHKFFINDTKKLYYDIDSPSTFYIPCAIQLDGDSKDSVCPTVLKANISELNCSYDDLHNIFETDLRERNNKILLMYKIAIKDGNNVDPFDANCISIDRLPDKSKQEHIYNLFAFNQIDESDITLRNNIKLKSTDTQL